MEITDPTTQSDSYTQDVLQEQPWYEVKIEGYDVNINADPYAGFGVRFFAYLNDRLINLLLLTITIFVSSIVIDSVASLTSWLLVIVCYGFAFSLLVSISYQSYFTSRFGGSLGKLIAGLKIFDDKNLYLDLRRSVLRYSIGYWVASLLGGFGFYWIIKDKDKQGWHDMIAESYVKRHVPVGISLVRSFAFSALIFGAVFLIGSETVLNFYNNQKLRKNIDEYSKDLEQSIQNASSNVNKIENQYPF